MTRRPRADAERNRTRVLAAARALLSARGDEVQLPEIARAAEVGVGTVYRHFPTRADLIEALAELRFAEIAEFARTACAPDPANGLVRYLRHVGEVLATDRALSAAIESARGSAGSEPRGGARADLERAVGTLVDQGRAAGTLRPDLTTSDVFMLVGGLSATIRTGSGDWHRYLDLIRTGIRASE